MPLLALRANGAAHEFSFTQHFSLAIELPEQ